MHNFFFGIYPYIALGVCIMGCIARYERDPFTWKTSSSQLLRRKQLMIGSQLFHVGILIIFFGHFIGLLTPIQIFDYVGVSHGAKQLLAIIAGGIAGTMALIGGMMLLHRRLTDPRILRTSSWADIAIMILLLVQLVLGMFTIIVSLHHLDGAEMTKFMALAQGIFTFDRLAASYIQDVHWVFKAHIILGLTIILVFPFTRLVHMLSVPVRYLTRPGYQVVRSRRQAPLPARPATDVARQPAPAPRRRPEPAE